MTDDRRIRERAYAIWEDAGRPEGRHEAHWDQARQEIGSKAPAVAAEPAAKPGRAGKAKSPTPAAPDGGSAPAEVAVATEEKGKAKKSKPATKTAAATLAAPDGGGSTPAEAAAAKPEAKKKSKKA
ncbi:DUF2934 domain-containing protein [Pararoseomonas sp. SCSIO 73927]|uniref:DUF2934 domain-containing protein n=1 Tax=Pararoseomonas sp. SCSIO 73927 TaxID=3114537 RepID=UPI0030CEF510